MITSIKEFIIYINYKIKYNEEISEAILKTYPLISFTDALFSYLDKNNILYTVKYIKYKLSLTIYDITIENIKELNNIVTVYGYFISIIEYNKKDNFISYDNLIKIKNLEIDLANIDIEPNKNPSSTIIKDKHKEFSDDIIYFDITYHVTNQTKVNKILKNGLVPKAECKLTQHPQRVYVCDLKQVAIELIPKMIETSPTYYNYDEKGNKISINTTYVLFEINSKGIKFHKDPNHSMAYYTYENISPDKIKIIDTI